MRGKLFVVSGPSGVGKNTLLNAVVARSVHVRYSISATSRAMRPGEVDGKSYYFVTREQFEKLIADDALLEYAEYVGNYYGTPLQPIREAIEAGTDIVMDVDVVGALKIKKRLPCACSSRRRRSMRCASGSSTGATSRRRRWPSGSSVRGGNIHRRINMITFSSMRMWNRRPES